MNVRLMLAAAVVCGVLLLLLLLPRPVSQTEIEASASAMAAGSGSAAPVWAGTEACLECHQEQHQSWLMSAHSRAMSAAMSGPEPADGLYLHAASGRQYQSKQRDGELWHTETAVDANGVPTGNSVEVQLKYLVGSGRHSRTYLAELDGFLTESPLTWYASSGTWSMSPGYDHGDQQGFERPVDTGCLICHSGRIESQQGSFHRLKIGEPAIGCERCHGPGAGHSEYQRSLRSGSTAAADLSAGIVNPAKLSRELQDAICAQCHLRGDATVFSSGRTAEDCIPGRPLTDVRIDWFLSTGDGEMKVTGHSDQMSASRCWTESRTLTCTSCHAGHAAADNSISQAEAGTAAALHYRSICLKCHTDEACHATAIARAATVPQDNCVTCHMPQVSTDIPHIAFTHHRIGLHQAKPRAAVDMRAAELVPFGEVGGVSAAELQRSHALACAEFAARAPTAELAAEFRERAVRELSALMRQPAPDGDAAAALARLQWEQGDMSAAVRLATQALRDSDLSIGGRVNALFVQGDALLQQRRFAEAVPPLRQLTGLRRLSEDWLILGLAEFQSGDRESGLKSVEKAAAIQPFRRDIPETLRKLQRAAGQR